MPRKVKCMICKKSIDIDKAYVAEIKIGKDNKTTKKYSCAKEEYDNYNEEKTRKKIREKRMSEVINRIINRENKNTLLFQKEREWISVPFALEAIENNEDYITRIIQNKAFNSEYAELRYLSAVIDNNLNDWIAKIKIEIENNMRTIEKSTTNIEFYETKKTSRKKRR